MARLRGALRALWGVSLVLAAAGCGGAPATPTTAVLSDPNEIVTTGIGRLGAATSLHIDGTINGTINAASLGTISGGSITGLSGSVKLDGSSMSGDVDLANRAFHVSASFPRLFATTADIVEVDGFVYTKVSLLGDKYTKSTLPPSLPLASSFPLAIALPGKGWASGAQATLVGREVVDGDDTYHVAMTVPMATLDGALAALAGGAAGGLTIDTATLDCWVSVATVQPVKLELMGSSASLGSLDLTLTLTKYNQPVTITAPPTGQVQSG